MEEEEGRGEKVCDAKFTPMTASGGKERRENSCRALEVGPVSPLFSASVPRCEKGEYYYRADGEDRGKMGEIFWGRPGRTVAFRWEISRRGGGEAHVNTVGRKNGEKREDSSSPFSSPAAPWRSCTVGT